MQRICLQIAEMRQSFTFCDLYQHSDGKSRVPVYSDKVCAAISGNISTEVEEFSASHQSLSDYVSGDDRIELCLFMYSQSISIESVLTFRYTQKKIHNSTTVSTSSELPLGISIALLAKQTV